MQQVRALWRLLADPEPGPRVGWRWLLKSTGAISRRFARRASVESRPDGDARIVRINGQEYVWPASSPLDALLVMACELTDPQHPHQYLWGPTQIQAGDVVLDVGACEGAFAARIAAMNARPVVVEPSPRMQRVIRRLFEIRGLAEPAIIGCAIGREPGQCWMREDVDNPGAAMIRPEPAAGAVPIPIKTVDQLVDELGLDRLNLIKVDAEGSDVDIVRSAEKTLRRLRPKLAICTYHADGHYRELYPYLTGLGYHVCGKGYLHSAGRFRVMMLHAW